VNAKESHNLGSRTDRLILVAINDENLWEEVSKRLRGRYQIRRERNGLKAMDVLLLIRPIAVIAETGLPGLSGVLLARLIGHNRHLASLPVALILSREYLIEEFWAKESGAVVIASRKSAYEVVDRLEAAIAKAKPVSEEDWNAAEEAIKAQGGAAAGVAAELERELIGASILARLGEIEIGAEPEGETGGSIPTFIGEALGALASVLEFAQAGIALLATGDLYIVDNEVFSGQLEPGVLIRETQASASLYIRPGMEAKPLKPHHLPPVHHELPGPLERASTFFALPLTGRQGVYGILSIMTYKQIAIREYYLHTLSLIGSQLAVNLERALFYEEVRRLSVTDSLTGLSNRRALIARLEQEFRRSTRYGTPLSLAISDLDDFKQINDKYGHLAGDAVLRGVATIMRKSVREVDLAGRWGGEELAMVFPQTDLAGALSACERVRKEIEKTIFEFEDKKLRITLSIGVATLNPAEVSPRSAGVLIGFADRAMYLAKSRGKNQVASFLELE